MRLTTITREGYEKIVVCRHDASGLHSIIALHNSRLGPGLGGCRFLAYPDQDTALADVLNLSQAMTYKAALAGLPLGGGKAVIIGNPATDKSEKLWKAYAGFVDHFAGLYITTEDSGTTTADMEMVAKYSQYVTGTPSEGGGSDDPSPMTALGVKEGIRACAKFLYGSEDISGKRVAIQGVGQVGISLARYLKELGAELIVTDIKESKLKTASTELGAEVVGQDEIFSVPCDIFAPCALGGVINEKTLPQLKCKIVAGAANNQLVSDDMAEQLHARGIIYAPDFAINAGGLISVAGEALKFEREEALTRTKDIFKTIGQILETASKTNTLTLEVSRKLAEERFKG